MWFKLDRSQISLILILSISLGLIFRLSNLDQKVFWVDEVATVLRASGYTKQEVIANLADGNVHFPPELLNYQRLQPDRTLSDAMTAFQTSPEHAPLYFLLTRFWMQMFGSSLGAVRSFSVLCSLLLLPAIYRLSRSIFNSVDVSRWAVILTAVSPLFVAYAQEARPYSFWVLSLTLSSIALLRSLQNHRMWDWVLYALTLTISFYTSLLSLIVAIGQAIYVLTTQRHDQKLHRFSWAFLSAIVAVLPWIGLIMSQWSTLQSNTTWMRLPIDSVSKAMIWVYSIAIVYFDVPVITQPLWVGAIEVIVAAIVISIIIFAFYKLLQKLRQPGWFVLSLAIPVPLILIVTDLISNGRYSTAPRYMLPFQLGTQLAVAYLLAYLLTDRISSQSRQRQFGQGIAVFLIGLSLISNLIHLNTSPRYLKNRNLNNSAIATLINQTDDALVVSEAENTIDLLSLSHSLEPDVKIKIISQQSSSESTHSVFSSISENPCQNSLLFNPSPELKQQLQHSQVSLEERYHPQTLNPSEFSLSLWQLKLKNAC